MAKHREVSQRRQNRSRHPPPRLHIKGSPYPLRSGCSPPHIESAMVLTAVLLCAFSLASVSYGRLEDLERHKSSDFLCICNQIEVAISSASQLFFSRKHVTPLICDALS